LKNVLRYQVAADIVSVDETQPLTQRGSIMEKLNETQRNALTVLKHGVKHDMYKKDGGMLLTGLNTATLHSLRSKGYIKGSIGRRGVIENLEIVS